MLQIDHIYEFLGAHIFNKNFSLCHLPGGVVAPEKKISSADLCCSLGSKADDQYEIFLYDQEPLIEGISESYITAFLSTHMERRDMPAAVGEKLAFILAVSEKSAMATDYKQRLEPGSDLARLDLLYYFFHGFAALDWYRGFYALNYNKLIIKEYKKDYISFNRIINDDRSYRIYFISQLKAQGILDQGLVSFNVADDASNGWKDQLADRQCKLSQAARQHIRYHLKDVDRLVIDQPKCPAHSSSDIPRTNSDLDLDCFWHIVTETVFYYDKLHLTEKIFKPIVSKQPFMLLAAPGNLAYLKSYGFKTFDSVLDESYDTIMDHDLRTEAVVAQLHWYCNLTPEEKQDVIFKLVPIIEFNFHHFYNNFKHIIVKELLDNCKRLFTEIEYDDNHLVYGDIYQQLVK